MQLYDLFFIINHQQVGNINGYESFAIISYFQLLLLTFIGILLLAFLFLTLYTILKFIKTKKSQPQINNSSDDYQELSFLISRKQLS